MKVEGKRLAISAIPLDLCVHRLVISSLGMGFPEVCYVGRLEHLSPNKVKCCHVGINKLRVLYRRDMELVAEQAAPLCCEELRGGPAFL